MIGTERIVSDWAQATWDALRDAMIQPGLPYSWLNMPGSEAMECRWAVEQFEREEHLMEEPDAG